MKIKNRNLIFYGIGIVLLVFIFGVMQTVIPTYEIISLDYSGSTKLSGVEDPAGYIVTGIDNCGGRANNLGYTQYHTCEIDPNSLQFMRYEICTENKIKDINSVYIQFSGNTECLDMKGSSSSCVGTFNVYNENENLIGDFQQEMRFFSDGLRGTDGIDEKLNVDMSEYDLFGENCFDILISNPSKHRAKWDLIANYNIVEAGVDYDPVECEIDSECEIYEECNNFDCQLRPEEDVTVWRLEGSSCKEIVIGSFSVTENDYSTESGCINQTPEEQLEVIELNNNLPKIIGFGGIGIILVLIVAIIVRIRKK